MEEQIYQNLLNDFIDNRITAENFVISFMDQWKIDRDKYTVFDSKFQRLIDRLFTTCDCYCLEPQNKYEINEDELRKEVDLLRHIWFG